MMNKLRLLSFWPSTYHNKNYILWSQKKKKNLFKHSGSYMGKVLPHQLLQIHNWTTNPLTCTNKQFAPHRYRNFLNTIAPEIPVCACLRKSCGHGYFYGATQKDPCMGDPFFFMRGSIFFMGDPFFIRWRSISLNISRTLRIMRSFNVSVSPDLNVSVSR